MTLSLAAVFIPILFMSGIVGRLLHEFAVTIGVAILVSGFVSISLTPMLAARFLRPPHELRHGRVYQAIETAFNVGRDAYGWALRLAMRHHVVTMGISVLLVLGTVQAFSVIPKGFIPSQDIGPDFRADRGHAGHWLRRDGGPAEGGGRCDSREPQRAHADLDDRRPGLSAGRMLIELKPRDQRTRSADEIITDLRPKMAAIPGIKVYLQNPPVINIGGRQAARSISSR
jgi:HAE1 family hydrophobic/amphiphilic exporter-1